MKSLFVVSLIVAGLFVFTGLRTPIQQQEEVKEPVTTAPQMSIDERLEALGLILPEPATSLAIYKRVVVVGDMVYLSGHIPIDTDGKIMTGKVGDRVDIEEGQAAAKRCALAILASMKEELGSLDRVKRLVKTTGMVNCTADFTQQPEVVNGFSQVFVDVWGDDNGKGARAAVGMASLPRGAICEIEAIFQLK